MKNQVESEATGEYETGVETELRKEKRENVKRNRKKNCINERKIE